MTGGQVEDGSVWATVSDVQVVGWSVRGTVTGGQVEDGSVSAKVSDG